MKHLRKDEYRFWRRATALLCAAMLVLLMVPREVLTAWAADADGVELEASETEITLNYPESKSQTVTLSLTGDNVSQYTLKDYTVSVTEEEFINYSIENNVLTLTSLPDKVGDVEVSVTANLKKTDTSEDPENQKEANLEPQGEAPATDEETYTTNTVQIKVTMNYTYQLTAEIVREDGETDAAIINTPLKAQVSETNGADIGSLVYTYQWKKDGASIENATESSYTPTSAGDYTVEVTAAENEDIPLVNKFVPSAPLESAAYTVGKGKPNITSDCVVFPEKLTYGDKPEETKITLKSFGVAGEYKFHYDTEEIVTVAMTAADDMEVTADGLHLDLTAGKDKELKYKFIPDNTDDYETINDGVFTYTVDPYEITVRVTVPDKRYDGTTAVKYYDATNVANQNPTIAVSNQVSDRDKITYGLDSESHFVDADKEQLKWKLDNIELSDFQYENAGNVAENTEVEVQFVGNEDATLYFINDDGQGEEVATLNNNYKVALTFAKATIEKNSFPDAYELKEEDYYLDSATSTYWFRGTQIKAHANTAGGYTLSTTEDGTYSSTVECGLAEDGTVTLYAKSSSSLIAEVTLAEKVAVDSESPTVSYISAATAGGTPATSGTLDFAKEKITYTFQAADENGSGLKKAQYAVTTGAVCPADDASDWKEAALTNGNFTVEASQSSYVWVRAEDNVGNVFDNDGSSIRALVIETNKPVVTVNPSPNGMAYAKSYAVSITADDEKNVTAENKDGQFSGIQSITAVLNDKDGNLAAQKVETFDPAQTRSDIKAKETTTVTLPEESETPDGEYTLSVTARDFSGNEADPVEKTLLFDNTPPELTISMSQSETAETYYYRAENCGITVSMKDAHTAIASCTVTVSNGSTTLTKQLSDGIGNESGTAVTVSFTAEEVAALDLNGNTTVTISVTAEDSLGNSTNVVTRENVTGVTLGADGTSASFVLDTVAPKLTAVTCAQVGKGPYQDDGVATYYYNDAEVKLTFTVEETNFESVELSYQRDGTAETPISPSSAGDLSVSLTKEGLYSSICISGEDKAGNRLVLGFASSSESAEYVTESNGVITMAYNKVIDRTAPKAVITYTGTADGKKDTDGTNTYYYNANIEAKVAISDDRSLVGLSWEIQKTENGGTPEAIAITEATTPYQETLAKDGKYHFTVNSESKDRAGNPVVITYEDSKLGSLSNPSVVIDTVAPVASFSVSTTAANTQLQSSYDNRFYFNSHFTAELKVTDDNYDASLISAKYGYDDADDTQNGTVTPGSAMSTGGTGFTYSASADGIYQFEFSGTDKAGNKLTLGSAGSSSSIGQNPFASVGDTLSSYVFVVDTVAPTAEIKVDDYYAASLTSDGYHVSANSPYRKEKEATLSFTASDKSPAKIDYVLYTSLSENSISGDSGSYQRNASGSNTFQGEQIFAIESLTLTDLAGNSTAAPQTVDGRVSNKIYLDATAPTDDQLTPMVKLVAKESGQGRSTAGVDLYDGTVTVEAIVSEPGYSDRETGGKSSGLYTVYYEVLQNNSDNFTSVLTGTVKSAGTNNSDGLVRYGSGSAYSETENEKIVGKDTLIFTFDAAKFNFNDISLRVWAEDNSGNVLQKENGAVYRFGIDTSSPTISVRYDNNSAQNSKYFKENRTAQIVVHERNFDPSRTVITTQAGTNAGWTYQKGASGNGDDDTWTTTVSYATDGDYTLAVSTADLVGHSTAEVDFGDSVAPREFTIDKTVPVISVSFDNEEGKNGKYYNKPRTATVLINEHNFGASAANVAVSASIQEGSVATPSASGWSSAGDSNTASVAFSEDGNYSMQIQFTDLAGNAAQAVSVDEFTVDTTAPELTISGVEDRVAYGDVSISPSVIYHDINYDSSSVVVSISGYKHEADEVMSGTRVDEPYGGSFICDSIAKVRSADDIYTATGTISDLAGNTTTAEVQFSVNRFGSNYILSESIRSLVGDETVEGSYYTNQSPVLEVTEVNVNSLVNHSVNTSWNGSVTELTEGTDYEIQTTLAGWSETTYRIFAENFEDEGAYVVTLTSEDEAENHNTNRSVKGDNGVNSSVDLNFSVDKTAPMCFFTGVSGNERYNAAERDISVNFTDNSRVEKLILSVSTDDGTTEKVVAELDGDQLASLDGVYHYVAQAANDWQVLRVTAIDAAGNSNAESIQGEQAEPVEVRYLLTTSLLVQYVNSVPALVATGVILLGGGAVVVLLLRRRRYVPKKMK